MGGEEATSGLKCHHRATPSACEDLKCERDVKAGFPALTSWPPLGQEVISSRRVQRQAGRSAVSVGAQGASRGRRGGSGALRARTRLPKDRPTLGSEKCKIIEQYFRARCSYSQEFEKQVTEKQLPGADGKSAQCSLEPVRTARGEAVGRDAGAAVKPEGKEGVGT